MAIKKAAIDPMELSREKSRQRTVTQQDADTMKASPGEWFEVKVRAKNPSAISSMNGVLKRSLPHWYGGQWELVMRQGVLYCRFLQGISS
jgi:hypothetical protein